MGEEYRPVTDAELERLAEKVSRIIRDFADEKGVTVQDVADAIAEDGCNDKWGTMPDEYDPRGDPSLSGLLD